MAHKAFDACLHYLQAAGNPCCTAQQCHAILTDLLKDHGLSADSPDRTRVEDDHQRSLGPDHPHGGHPAAASLSRSSTVVDPVESSCLLAQGDARLSLLTLMCRPAFLAQLHFGRQQWRLRRPRSQQPQPRRLHARHVLECSSILPTSSASRSGCRQLERCFARLPLRLDRRRPGADCRSLACRVVTRLFFVSDLYCFPKITAWSKGGRGSAKNFASRQNLPVPYPREFSQTLHFYRSELVKSRDVGRDLDLDEHLGNGERLDSNVGPEGCMIGKVLSDGLDDGFLRDGAVRDGERGELTDVQGDECQSAMGSTKEPTHVEDMVHGRSTLLERELDVLKGLLDLRCDSLLPLVLGRVGVPSTCKCLRARGEVSIAACHAVSCGEAYPGPTGKRSRRFEQTVSSGGSSSGSLRGRGRS